MARWQVQSDPPFASEYGVSVLVRRQKKGLEPGCTLHCIFAFAIPPPLLTRAQKLRCV